MPPPGGVRNSHRPRLQRVMQPHEVDSDRKIKSAARPVQSGSIETSLISLVDSRGEMGASGTGLLKRFHWRQVFEA